jgi:hypothetical protein
VSSLNRLIDDAHAGRTVFYDIYTDAEMNAEPSRRNTGLFFFRGTPGAPFAVIAPGGGFVYVGSLHEGFPHAVEISNRGYNAFVLKYRVGRGGSESTEDLAAALVHLAERGRAWRGDHGLFAVGQFRWREDGRGDWFPWHRIVRWFGFAKAIGPRPLVHRSFGCGGSGAAHVRGGWWR